MAKTTKGKVIQMLSPVNYIRQKARTLPVYECVVNSGWDKSNLANLVIARKHTNGNITAGIYLVDLDCLGVKDTHWFFNITEAEYREYIDRVKEIEDGLEKIDYVLAHNIVHAGIDFADDYEFKPHKDYTSVTQYILDEDTDDIPIIDIECGTDGLPVYMPGPLHIDTKAKQVIAHLERVAGPGNYYLLDEEGRLLGGDNDDDDDDTDDEFDPFEAMDFEEKKALFLDGMAQKDDMDDYRTKEFLSLNQSIIDDLVDYNLCDNYFEVFETELNDIRVDDNFIPDQMLGKEPGDAPLPDIVKEQFLYILRTEDDLKKQKKLFKNFRKNKDVEAATDYLELMIAELEESDKYGALLQSAALKYPDYGLLKIRLIENRLAIGNIGIIDDLALQYHNFFNERESIYSYEYFAYVYMRTMVMAQEKNLEKLEAWKHVLSENIDKAAEIVVVLTLVMILQITLVADRLEKV